MIPLRDDTINERLPLITVSFLLVNLAAFLWQVGLLGIPEAAARGDLLDLLGAVAAGYEGRIHETAHRGGVIPFEILTFQDVDLPNLVPPPLTIVTSMFLHGGVVHIASNLLFLWVFGRAVEDALGRRRFVLFYLLCGTAAALVQVVASAATGDILVPMVGASGAIAGVLAAYVLLFPRARVSTLVLIVVIVRVIPVPAGFFIGIWFVLQILSVLFGGNTGVAFFAHIGGFVAGFLVLRVLGRRAEWRPRRASG